MHCACLFRNINHDKQAVFTHNSPCTNRKTGHIDGYVPGIISPPDLLSNTSLRTHNPGFHSTGPALICTICRPAQHSLNAHLTAPQPGIHSQSPFCAAAPAAARSCSLQPRHDIPPRRCTCSWEVKPPADTADHWLSPLNMSVTGSLRHGTAPAQYVSHRLTASRHSARSICQSQVHCVTAQRSLNMPVGLTASWHSARSLRPHSYLSCPHLHQPLNQLRLLLKGRLHGYSP